MKPILNIAIYAKLREFNVKNNKMYLACKNCKKKLDHIMQFESRTCSQICFNCINYSDYINNLNFIQPIYIL